MLLTSSVLSLSRSILFDAVCLRTQILPLLLISHVTVNKSTFLSISLLIVKILIKLPVCTQLLIKTISKVICIQLDGKHSRILWIYKISILIRILIYKGHIYWNVFWNSCTITYLILCQYYFFYSRIKM